MTLDILVLKFFFKVYFFLSGLSPVHSLAFFISLYNQGIFRCMPCLAFTFGNWGRSTIQVGS